VGLDIGGRALRIIAGFCLAVACTLAASALADEGAYPKTEAELEAAYEALAWHRDAGSYKLPISNATIELPAGRSLLLGGSAQRYSWLAGGVEYPDTEAVLIDESGGAKTEVYYEWRDEGYVSDSDWEEVDGDALLTYYRDVTEASNEERAKNRLEPMHVVGWLEPPRYDQATRTVTYAVELTNKYGNWTNGVALRLGRAGYAEVTWVGPVDEYQGSGERPSLLNYALATHSFDEGYRYEDFKDADKVATYGVAGLVATALGVEFAKEGAVVLLAEIAIPALAVFALIVLRFKELFGSFRWRS
jgi:uncharacterized membrane-anchored protein